jgi:hypothetical protein
MGWFQWQRRLRLKCEVEEEEEEEEEEEKASVNKRIPTHIRMIPGLGWRRSVWHPAGRPRCGPWATIVSSMATPSRGRKPAGAVTSTSMTTWATPPRPFQLTAFVFHRTVCTGR